MAQGDRGGTGYKGLVLLSVTVVTIRDCDRLYPVRLLCVPGFVSTCGLACFILSPFSLPYGKADLSLCPLGASLDRSTGLLFKGFFVLSFVQFVLPALPPAQLLEENKRPKKGVTGNARESRAEARRRSRCRLLRAA